MPHDDPSMTIEAPGHVVSTAEQELAQWMPLPRATHLASLWTEGGNFEATPQWRAAMRVLLEELERRQFEADFYRRRCEALQEWQSRMRDPERTVVCDILANRFTLPPANAGDRYDVKA